MAYMMIESKELSTGGLVIAGYGMIRNIPEHERKVLKVRKFHYSFNLKENAFEHHLF